MTSFKRCVAQGCTSYAALSVPCPIEPCHVRAANGARAHTRKAEAGNGARSSRKGVLAAMRTLVTLIDAARGEYSDPVVLSSVVACAPACVLAYQLAGLLEGKVNPTLFRGLVVGKLMLNGLILLAPAAIELAAQAADKQ